MSEPVKGAHLKQAWLVLTLALGFGAALAAVQLGLGPMIEKNKEDEARLQVPRLLIRPDMTAEQAQAALADLDVQKGRFSYLADGSRTEYPYYHAADANGRALGWVVQAKGNGYAGPIELLVGLNPDASRILGIYILSQTETPGLGNAIVELDWRKQFADANAARALEVVKSEEQAGPGKILALSGATISSRSVTDIVNRTTRVFRENLPTIARQMAGEPASRELSAWTAAEAMTVLRQAPPAEGDFADGANDTRLAVLRAVDGEGKLLGYLAVASGRGYAGPIELLVATGADGRRIAFVRVLGQRETRGAAKLTSPDWLAQFAGKPAAAALSLERAADPNAVIEAVSGATVSSKAIVRIVNAATAAIRGQAGPGPGEGGDFYEINPNLQGDRNAQ